LLCFGFRFSLVVQQALRIYRETAVPSLRPLHKMIIGRHVVVGPPPLCDS
jgi:hypothetical protein